MPGVAPLQADPAWGRGAVPQGPGADDGDGNAACDDGLCFVGGHFTIYYYYLRFISLGNQSIIIVFISLENQMMGLLIAEVSVELDFSVWSGYELGSRSSEINF